MTFDLSSEQQRLRDEVRAFAATRVAPAAGAIDESGEVPADVLREAEGFVTRAPRALDAALVVEEIAVASGSVAAAAACGAGRAELPGLRGARAVPKEARDARVRLLVSAVALGVGRCALDAALDVCRAGGERPGGSPEERPHWALADAATELEAARLLVWRSAQGVDARASAERDAALAQTLAIGAADRAVATALRIVGADGYRRGERLERLVRDARTLAFFAGTEEEQRLMASADLPA